jgi:hypothetical protein
MIFKEKKKKSMQYPPQQRPAIGQYKTQAVAVFLVIRHWRQYQLAERKK